MKQHGQYKYKMRKKIKCKSNGGKINKELAIITLIVLSVLISSYATAFAVSSTYWSENPLTLYPGETKDFSFTLQNLAGSEEVKLKAMITQSSEVVSIIDPTNIYSVPAGRKTSVNLRVVIPEGTSVGKVYPFEIVFTTVAETEQGAFGIGSSIKQSFNVEVVEKPKPAEEVLPQEKPEEKISTWVTIGVVILILLVVIVIILKKRKKK